MEIEKELNDMILEIEEKKDNNIKLEEENKIIDKDLTPDGLPTIEKQLRDLDLLDKEMEEKNKDKEIEIYKREMTQRVKCLCLNKLNKSIFVNTLTLKEKERKKLKELMSEYNDIPCEEIIKEFNITVGEMLDDMEEKDYSKLPVYQI